MSAGVARLAEPPSWLREVLRCPATGGVLEDRRDADGRLVGLVSAQADPPLLYPVVDGVPVLLVDEATPADGSSADAPPTRAEQPGADGGPAGA